MLNHLSTIVATQCRGVSALPILYIIIIIITSDPYTNITRTNQGHWISASDVAQSISILLLSTWMHQQCCRIFCRRYFLAIQLFSSLSNVPLSNWGDPSGVGCSRTLLWLSFGFPLKLHPLTHLSTSWYEVGPSRKRLPTRGRGKFAISCMATWLDATCSTWSK